MENFLTIIYAHRNRDLSRIQTSLRSLENQRRQNFEVIFIDYGSDTEILFLLEDLIKKFSFVKLIKLDVSKLLWNKSKALNIGIRNASSPFIFIADVDLIFHGKAISLMCKTASSSHFQLFTLAYLNKLESEKLSSTWEFENVKIRNYGKVNGMILASKEAFETIHGYDEFFHFYGAEDEDVHGRLENAGYRPKLNEDEYFFHYWHQSYAASEENMLTIPPRVHNIRRINQRHFLNNKQYRIKKPLRQQQWGMILQPSDFFCLSFPTIECNISNIKAHVDHFLHEEFQTFKRGEVVKVNFVKDPYYYTLTHRVKKILGRQSQPFCSLKEVNDMVLKKIVFQYRDHIYSYKIAEDLTRITLRIKI